MALIPHEVISQCSILTCPAHRGQTGSRLSSRRCACRTASTVAGFRGRLGWPVHHTTHCKGGGWPPQLLTQRAWCQSVHVHVTPKPMHTVVRKQGNGGGVGGLMYVWRPHHLTRLSSLAPQLSSVRRRGSSVAGSDEWRGAAPSELSSLRQRLNAVAGTSLAPGGWSTSVCTWKREVVWQGKPSLAGKGEGEVCAGGRRVHAAGTGNPSPLAQSDAWSRTGTGARVCWRGGHGHIAPPAAQGPAAAAGQRAAAAWPSRRAQMGARGGILGGRGVRGSAVAWGGLSKHVHGTIGQGRPRACHDLRHTRSRTRRTRGSASMPLAPQMRLRRETMLAVEGGSTLTTTATPVRRGRSGAT